MAQAVAAYQSVTASDEFKELERLREKARHDGAAALANAERRGKIEGIREGKIEGKIEGIREGKIEGIRENAVEIAKTLKAKGIDINIIAEAANLSVDDILKM
jgi:predicted transposase/invertase (TIGR01784 family)